MSEDVMTIEPADLADERKPSLHETPIIIGDAEIDAASVAAMTKPSRNVTAPPVQVVLCLDTSGSMEAADFQPNRFLAARDAACLFLQRKILQNKNDEAAVVLFGGQATTLVRMTDDLDLARKSLQNYDRITHTETSLGVALQEAAKLLPTSRSPENAVAQAIILLTDGDSWRGPDPLELAVGLAKRGVRVFTIGVGTAKGAQVKLPGLGSVTVRLNEKILRQIADKTGGRYYNATDLAVLLEIYLLLAEM